MSLKGFQTGKLPEFVCQEFNLQKSNDMPLYKQSAYFQHEVETLQLCLEEEVGPDGAEDAAVGGASGLLRGADGEEVRAPGGSGQVGQPEV
jgi:hypothetical protein